MSVDVLRKCGIKKLLHSSTVAPADFGAVVSRTLSFSPCDTEHCVDINIVDDFVLENDESFFVTLLRTPVLDSRIDLTPVNEEIVILDNDSEHSL